METNKEGLEEGLDPVAAESKTDAFKRGMATGKIQTGWEIVFNLLKSHGPLTCFHVEDLIAMLHQTASAVFSVLRRAKHVEGAGRVPHEGKKTEVTQWRPIRDTYDAVAVALAACRDSVNFKPSHETMLMIRFLRKKYGAMSVAEYMEDLFEHHFREAFSKEYPEEARRFLKSSARRSAKFAAKFAAKAISDGTTSLDNLIKKV